MTIFHLTNNFQFSICCQQSIWFLLVIVDVQCFDWEMTYVREATEISRNRNQEIEKKMKKVNKLLTFMKLFNERRNDYELWL